MNDRQKKIALIAGGILTLLLAYRFYTARSNTAATGSPTPATNTAASDYAALAGQEQGDVAQLQQDLAGMSSTEQSDIAGLQAGMSGLASQSDVAAQQAQEQADIGGLGGSIADLLSGLQGLSGTVSGLGAAVAGDHASIAELGAGQAQADRHAAIQTHKGGAFYKYYVKVNGHAPPAHVNVTDFVYEAWKSGVKAAALVAPHPSAPRNNSVAHPNPGHHPQSGTRASNRPGPGKQRPNTMGRRSGRRR